MFWKYGTNNRFLRLYFNKPSLFKDNERFN